MRVRPHCQTALRGDVAPDAAAVAVCTPVPGGIGSVTTALPLRHTVQLPKICAIFKQIFTNSCSFPPRETL
ncbi:MAG: hypothetical protein ACLTG4_02500 [Oscillospiraceae bacterium]